MPEEMSFWDHLDVLRACLLRVVVVLLVAVVGCFIALPYIFDDFILGPAVRGGISLININVSTPFLMHISTAFWMGLLLVFPFLMYQIWVFVRPALYPHEVKGVKWAFFGGTLLFYAGCALSYLSVFPVAFRFLAGYELSASVPNTISLNSYMSLFIGLIFAMGVLFELPVLAWLLGRLGVVDRAMLASSRRYAVVVLLVLAAVITPTGDPFTLLLVFAPLYLLYEVSILALPRRAAPDSVEPTS